jgi:hypothetical protein
MTDMNDAAQVSKNPRLLQRSIRGALKMSMGNPVAAARVLKMSVSQLRHEMEMSHKMREYIKLLSKRDYKHLDEYRKLTLEEVDKDLKIRAALYRSEALDALHQLASLEVTAETNSALAQVKLLAAQKLYQEVGPAENPNEVEATLRVLNQRFQEAAPRIKQIRERIIQFDGAPALTNTQVIEASPD